MSEAETKAAQDLRVTSTETSPVLRTLEVEVDAARVARAFARAYRQLGRRAKVKGFRPGKAPRARLEQLYGAGVADEVAQQLVNETFGEAVAQCGALPVAEPAIDTPQPATDGAAFRYSARVEVCPEIALPALTKLAAERPAVAVSDEEVAREIENLRERQAREEPLGEDARAANGHILTVDYAGKIDGAPFEGGSAQGAKLELGAGRFIPGFEEPLLGAKAGELREVAVDFPADYAAEQLRGKHAVFAVTVHALAQRTLPAADDEFARSFGDDAVQDMAALRAQLTQRMREQRERAAQQALERSVVDALLARCKFETPPGMVRARLAQRLEMAQQQFGHLLPREALEKQLLALREEWQPEAERDVRASLVLSEVAKAHALAPDDAEVDAHLDELAREQGLAPARLREHAAKENLRPGIEAQLARQKAVAKLLEGAQVREVPAPEKSAR